MTKVGSRFVVQIAAVILILLGLFGKFGALAAAIPKPVVGGLYCALFGLIAAVGVRQFAKADLNSDRNLFIGGFALFMGLSLPYWFQSAEGAATIQMLRVTFSGWFSSWWGGAAGTSAAWHTTLADGLVDSLDAVGKTGMAVAAILGLFLDNLIPGSRAERGLPGPGVLVPEAADINGENPTPK